MLRLSSQLENYWRIEWARLLVESLLKFSCLSAKSSLGVFTRYPSISRVSRIAVSLFGGALGPVSGLIGRDLPHGYSTRLLISRRSSSLSILSFVIESGLILFLFLFAAYFRLSVGPVVVWHLVRLRHLSSARICPAWAIIANASPSGRADLVRFSEHGYISSLLYSSGSITFLFPRNQVV